MGHTSSRCRMIGTMSLSLALAACGEKEPQSAEATQTARPSKPSQTAEANTLPQTKTKDKGHPVDDVLRARLFDSPVRTLDGKSTTLGAHRNRALLIVNVASKCGLTPQYAGLEQLQKKYNPDGFTVIGFPCNQFGGQEPGTADEIKSFCSTNYGITFPMMEKVEVNGDQRHPIYAALTSVPDSDGKAGDILWNFEKFVVSANRKTITRFRPRTEPSDATVIAVIEGALSKARKPSDAP